jgi:hypothetical protein
VNEALHVKVSATTFQAKVIFPGNSLIWKAMMKRNRGNHILDNLYKKAIPPTPKVKQCNRRWMSNDTRNVADLMRM